MISANGFTMVNTNIILSMNTNTIKPMINTNNTIIITKKSINKIMNTNTIK